MKSINPKHFIPIYGLIKLETEYIDDKNKTTDEALNLSFIMSYHIVVLLLLTFISAEVF